MYVNHSGWMEKYGSFSYNIFVDEKRTDYVIEYASGKKLVQDGSFDNFTHDWNCDGDVYTQYGAFFQLYDKDGKFARQGIFMTPENMVRELVNSLDEKIRQREDVVVRISGISVPEPDKRPSLQEQVARTERQKFFQDVERNRKMKALGIRGPGEPWAR